MAFYCVSVGEREYRVRLSAGQATVDGEPVQLDLLPLNNAGLHLIQRGMQALEMYLRSQDAQTYEVLVAGKRMVAKVQTLQQRMQRKSENAPDGALLAPMPGLVLSIPVSPGEWVQDGQALAVLESMKMQMQIRAPHPGRVVEVSVQAGQQVEKGACLVRVEPEQEKTLS